VCPVCMSCVHWHPWPCWDEVLDLLGPAWHTKR
jgi:hypothetical protein